MEANGNNGSRGEAILNVQSDLALDLTVQDKASSTQEPELELVDVTENAGSRTWNLGVNNQYPWIGEW